MRCHMLFVVLDGLGWENNAAVPVFHSHSRLDLALKFCLMVQDLLKVAGDEPGLSKRWGDSDLLGFEGVQPRPARVKRGGDSDLFGFSEGPMGEASGRVWVFRRLRNPSAT
jgi:hypothetical protein